MLLSLQCTLPQGGVRSHQRHENRNWIIQRAVRESEPAEGIIGSKKRSDTLGCRTFEDRDIYSEA
jgi:hypothetical protein